MKVVTNTKGRIVNMPAPLPGREYFPNRDDMNFHNADGYLSKKQELDMKGEPSLQKLWRLHGEYYDLTKWAAEHPGGEEFITRSIGSDITTAFESHHIKHTRKQLLKMIARLKVDVAKDQEMNAAVQRVNPSYELPYTFNEGDFYDVFKQRAREYLKKQGHPSGKNTATMKVAMTTVVLQWAAAAYLAASTGKKRYAVLAGFLLVGCWGVGHNAFHSGSRLFRGAVGLTGFSHLEQMITHAQSHHLYPNTLLDIEVFAFAPVGLAWLTNENFETTAALSKYKLWPFLLSLLSLPDMVKRALLILLGKRRFEPAEFIPFGVLLSFLKIGGLRRGFRQWILMNIAFGVYFPMIGLSVHHSYDEDEVPRAWHEGEAKPERDFGLHQVIATSDHSTSLSTYPSLVLFGYLNHHIVHHLLPTVSHCHHRGLLNNVLIPTLKEFGHEYKCHNVCDLVKGFVRHIEQRRFKPVR